MGTLFVMGWWVYIQLIQSIQSMTIEGQFGTIGAVFASWLISFCIILQAILLKNTGRYDISQIVS